MNPTEARELEHDHAYALAMDAGTPPCPFCWRTGECECANNA